MVVTWAQSYLCESVLVQKTVVELQDLLEVCSQCASINGRIEEASHRCFEGWRVGLGAVVRASSPRAKHSNQSRSGCSGEIQYGYPLRLPRCLALSFGNKGVSLQTGEVPAVSAPALSGRITRVYKAKPKRSRMRLIGEVVSGSTDVWDVSKA
jgi:hypothetical protein